MKAQRLKGVFFWIFTGLLCFELVYGALWDFNILNQEYVYGILRHLGYPLYVASMLAWSKLLAAVVILLPRFPLQKEWAYTGVVILFTGAFISHVLSGDTISTSGFALGFGLVTILSWVLRPSDRKLNTGQPAH